MCWLDADSQREMEMALSDIKLDENCDPVFAVIQWETQYQGSLEKFAIFGWKTKADKIYTAFFPNIAFYSP